MKYVIQILEVVIIVVIIMISIFTYQQVNQSAILKSRSIENRAYHVAVVTDSENTYADNDFFKGLALGMDDFDGVYEIYNTQNDELKDIFDMIIMTDVNGVLVKLDNNTLAEPYVEACHEAGIFVINIGNDSAELLRDVYIGTNKFSTGEKAGQLASEAVKENGKIAIVLGNEYQEKEQKNTSNFVSGVYESVSKLALLNVSRIDYTQTRRAEIIMDEILDESPNINVIICTDPVDAIRMTRVLVDRNKVGDIEVISSGDTPDIKESINNQVIYATIVEDYEALGYLSMEYLYQLLNGESVSSYINIPTEIIDRSSEDEVE